MTWRNGLFAAILAGSWSGWTWMAWVASPSLRSSLLLLLLVVVLLTVAVMAYYRRRLTVRLVTANIALGSVVHLTVAGLLVAADRLDTLGLAPALASNWHHFAIGTLGVAAAFFTWTRARGREEVLAVKPKVGDPEPPPPQSPVLGDEPDWTALATELAAKEDASRLRQLDGLERISVVLAGEEPAVERLEAAQRVVRQSVLRLMAESRADEVEEEDLLSVAASLLEWGSQKLPELAELDVGDLLMAKAIADIRSQASEVALEFVDHRSLRAIHPIDRATAEDKCNERAEAARAALPLLRSNGMRLSEELIAAHEELAAFKSVTGFQVVEIDAGYVTFEGNGRREALQRAFGADEAVQVEVRLYRFEDAVTQAAIQRRVERVRAWKGVVDSP